MKKIKVMSIFGTRPEAIKMAPLVKELEQHPEIQPTVCVTAQHRGMLDQVLDIFDIHPQYDLDIMKNKQTLTDITTNTLQGMESVIQTEQPDLILVHGDTSTTFSGALAAFYQQVKVGHVEAGLRTFNKYEPFPEEMNRKLTTCLSDLNFAPTTQSKKHLTDENVNPDSIFITGNTAIDCLKTTIEDSYHFSVDVLNQLDFTNKKVIAMTAHRRENLGQPLENICQAVLEICNRHEDVLFVYAVHPNPAVVEVVQKYLAGHPQIYLVDPLHIKDMHNLLSRSYLVLTDSGGLQEEVPSMGKPVVVLRNVTERPEGIDAGTLKLAGTEKETIVNTIHSLLTDQQLYHQMAQAKNPFGDGFASQRIVEAILYYFGLRDTRPKDFHTDSV